VIRTRPSDRNLSAITESSAPVRRSSAAVSASSPPPRRISAHSSASNCMFQQKIRRTFARKLGGIGQSRLNIREIRRRQDCRKSRKPLRACRGYTPCRDRPPVNDDALLPVGYASPAKRDETALSPIFVVHRRAVSDYGHYFSPELSFGEAETLADAGFTGVSTGAPLSFSRTTMNFAGFVALAFRPTV
jgi:hypothetical protein